MIDSTNVLHTEEIKSILNLDINYLKDARKKRWIEIYTKSRIKSGDVDIDKMRRLIGDKHLMAGNKYPEPYPGLYEYMLKRFY